jgi:hypothetical protein
MKVEIKRIIDDVELRNRGEIFIAEDTMGYKRLFFQPKKGNLLVMNSDVTFEEAEQLEEIKK